MSESVARATRRDLRRAMGQAAVDRVVLHERAIEQHTETLKHLSDRLAKRERELDSLKMQQGASFNSLAEFCGRSWRQRLRWLFLGR